MSEETKWTWDFRDWRFLVGRNGDEVKAIDLVAVTGVEAALSYDNRPDVWVTAAGQTAYQLHDIPVEQVLEYWASAKVTHG
jgi:hypothetical protein